MEANSSLIDARKNIKGLQILDPYIYKDNRGLFFESWNKKIFDTIVDENIVFIQDNQSSSLKGVIRGLHYQLKPYEQGKLIRCVKGQVYDVAVDIRKQSPTFGKWYGVYLSEENKRQFWIPSGFAHGFIALSENANVLYKVSNAWCKECERTIRWDDPTINIDWPKKDTQIKLSEKDAIAPFISQLNYNDLF